MDRNLLRRCLDTASGRVRLWMYPAVSQTAHYPQTPAVENMKTPVLGRSGTSGDPASGGALDCPCIHRCQCLAWLEKPGNQEVLKKDYAALLSSVERADE